MKVAVASDDRILISEHFGRALGFEVFTINDGEIIGQERRENIGRSNGECGSCDHNIMIENIKDCDIVICYGMGKRIYSDLTKNDIQAFITEEKTVNSAINKFINNELKNRLDKLH